MRTLLGENPKLVAERTKRFMKPVQLHWVHTETFTGGLPWLLGQYQYRFFLTMQIASFMKKLTLELPWKAQGASEHTDALHSPGLSGFELCPWGTTGLPGMQLGCF